ncbi:MAG: hypothetical protein MK066_14400, partial [Crocinitomicaceae bacterium]|nr:hypothetical protein [Crocinitomicaceae bacterium]
IMGIIFTAGHFFTREFDFGYCLSLFIFSYTFSLLYHFTKSIWLVIGMHGGVNWVAFSFFGTNWQMGALYDIEMTGVPNWIVSYSHPIIGMIILIAVVFFHKMGLLKKLSS